MLRSILVDFYGTLVREDDAVVEAICTKVAESLGRRASVREVARLWAQAFAAQCLPAYGPDFSCQRKAARSSLSTVLETLGSNTDVDELLAVQFDYWQHPDLFADTRRFLSDCDVPVCIVSNIDRADLEAAIAWHALEPDYVVTSEDVRAYKPRPEIFERALQVLGARPDEVVHVGDSFSADVDGASRAGLRAVWLNRKGRQRETTTVAWAEVRDLRELSGVLADA